MSSDVSADRADVPTQVEEGMQRVGEAQPSLTWNWVSGMSRPFGGARGRSAGSAAKQQWRPLTRRCYAAVSSLITRCYLRCFRPDEKLRRSILTACYAALRSPSAANTGLTHTAIRTPPQHDARRRAGVRCVIDHKHAVDDDTGVRAARVVVRVGVGREVGEIVGVEDRDIGTPALREKAAVAQLQRLRRRAGHLVDRRFERQQVLLADIAADDAREGAVETRVRHALADRAIGRDAITVGADQRNAIPHDGADVVLADRGDQHTGRTVIGDQMVAQLVDRVGARGDGERGDGLAGRFRTAWSY